MRVSGPLASLRGLVLLVICSCVTARAQGSDDIHGVMQELAKGYELYVDEPSFDDGTAVVSVTFGCQQLRLGHIFGFGKDVDYFFAKTDEGWRFIRSRITRIT